MQRAVHAERRRQFLVVEFGDLADRCRRLVCVRHIAGICRIPAELHGIVRPKYGGWRQAERFLLRKWKHNLRREIAIQTRSDKLWRNVIPTRTVRRTISTGNTPSLIDEIVDEDGPVTADGNGAASVVWPMKFATPYGDCNKTLEFMLRCSSESGSAVLAAYTVPYASNLKKALSAIYR